MLRLAPKSRISGRLKTQFIGESHCFSAPRTAAIVNGTDLCFPITSCPPQAGLSQQSISREMGQNRAHNPLLKISKPGFRHIWPLAKLSAQARGHPKSIQSIKLPQIWLTQLLSGSLGTQIGAIFRFARARAPTVGRQILRCKRPPAPKLPGTLKPGSTQAV